MRGFVKNRENIIISPTLKYRFLKRLKVTPSGCVEWTGHLNRWGYGQLGIGREGTSSKMVLANVTHISWFLKYGVWPTKYVLHKCDNPKCVKPSHLFLGTAKDNAEDCISKGRHSRKYSFSREDLNNIDRLLFWRCSHKHISELYDVNKHVITTLAQGKSIHGLVKTSPQLQENLDDVFEWLKTCRRTPDGKPGKPEHELSKVRRKTGRPRGRPRKIPGSKN